MVDADETDLRTAQKLESIGRLASGIAHEINTPVQFVSDSTHFVSTATSDLARYVEAARALVQAVGAGTATPADAQRMLELELDTDLDYALENVPKALDRSLEGLSRVRDLVRSMKDFAHPDRREKVHADLNRAVATTLTIARGEYKLVAVAEHVRGEIPLVACHVGDINQVLLNLVVNAAHAIGDRYAGQEQLGQITVRTRVEGDWVVLDVQDDGGGIPPEVQGRMFDPFFTTKEAGRGSGQGLAICRKVVCERHGGQLTFDTEAGVGTTFHVRLPVG